MKMAQRARARLTLRLTATVHRKMLVIAKQNRRSLNSEIQAACEHSVTDQLQAKKRGGSK